MLIEIDTEQPNKLTINEVLASLEYLQEQLCEATKYDSKENGAEFLETASLVQKARLNLNRVKHGMPIDTRTQVERRLQTLLDAVGGDMDASHAARDHLPEIDTETESDAERGGIAELIAFNDELRDHLNG